MSNELEIRTLTARFFDGDTSLAEEQRLYELYRTATELPADLAPLKEMMEDWAAMKRPTPLPLPCREGSDYTSQPEGHTTPLPTREGQGGGSSFWLSLAASVLLLFTFGSMWYGHQQAEKDECVAYVYGERVTDRDIVMQEMHTAMASINDDEATDAMESQLKDLFSE